MMRRPFLRWLVFFSLAFILAAPALYAKGKLDFVARFTDAQLGFDVATYQDTELPAGKQKVGLLSLRRGSVRNSSAFDLFEWPKIAALWAKALQARSQSWVEVGSITETTPDPCTLALSAGPGVKFTISSANQATITYVLPESDLARFENALNRVKDFLALP